MRYIAVLLALSLAACGGRTPISGPLDSGSSTDDSSGNEAGTPIEAGSLLPAPGSSGCDGQPSGTCVRCSEGRWHCGSTGAAYDACSPGQNVCNVDGQPCVNCKSDGTGTMGVQCLNPGGDNNIEGTAVGVTCL
jgi:hypothetical protein